MTDLTEQWKKGELPDGEYWCLSVCSDVDRLYCYQNSFWVYKTEDDYYGLPVEIKQVIAPVPSYEEWKAAYEYEKYADNEIKNLKAQIAQLKELLKEWVQFEIEENPNDFTVMSERMSELANKTKEVLK